MKNHHFSLLCLCIHLLYQAPLSATSYSWNGVIGNWNVATNWTPNGVPGAADDVSIAAGTATLTEHTTIDDFTVTGGGQISGSYNLTINGTLTQNCFGCLLTVGTGDVIINGPFTWITGNIGNGTAGGNVIANGLITIPDGAAGHWVRKKTLICNGGVDWQGGNIGTSENGVWLIPFGATITESSSTNYLIYDNYGGGGTFENYGTFVKTGASTTYCGGGIGVVSFFNYGVLNHLGTGSMTFNGPMHNETGGIIQGTGSYLFNSTFTNGSTVAPGDGIGQMTMAIPSFPNSALQIEIGGAGGPGVGHDRLNINGNFAASMDTLHILLINGYEPAPGTSFQIVSATGTVNGEIADVFFPGDPAAWSIDYTSNSITVTYDGIMPVSYLWNGGSGNWTNPTKWTPNGVPGAIDNATIASEATVMLTEHEEVNHLALGTASFHTLDGNFNLLVNDDLVLGGFLYNGGNTNIAGDFIWNAGQVGNSGTSSDVTVEGLTTIQTGVHYLLGKTLYVNGGAVQTSGMYITFNGLLVVPDGRIYQANTPDGTGIYHYADVPGGIDNAGLFHRTGTGIYPVASPIVFNNTGTIELDASSSISFVAGSTLNNSGILKGAGTLSIAGSLTNTGTISPGSSVGELTIVRSSLPNFILEIEMSSNAGPGVGHDRLNVTGSFVADGTLTVELTGGYTPAVGTTYQIVSTTGTVSGTFDVLDLPGNESEWNVTYGPSNITLEYEGVIPTAYVWNGVTGNWTNPLNWTPNGIPTGIDNVTIHSGIVQLTDTTGVATLIFNGGQITGPHNITVYGNMVFSGQMNNDGNTVVYGTMDWVNGTLGNGTVTGEMTVHGLISVTSGTHYIKQKTLHAIGGINHTADIIYLEYGGILHIPVGEVFYANSTSGYGMFLGGASGGTVFNEGEIVRTIPGLYYFSYDIVLNNQGTLNTQQGTIILSGGGTHTGAFTADAGTTIRFNYGTHFLDGTTFDGAGLIDQTAGTLTMLSDITMNDFNMSGGIISGNFNLTINGNLLFNGQMHNQGNTLVSGNVDWANGTLGNGTVTGSMTVNGLITTSPGQHYIRKKTLNANGGIHHVVDQIYFEYDGVLHIPPGQEFLLNTGNGGGVFNGGSFGGSIQNEGICKRTIAGTNYITSSILFTNTGTVKAETGIIYFAGGSTLTNSGILSGNSKITIEGSFTNTGSYAPGNAVGELQMERTTLSNNILEIELLNNSGPGTGHDRLNVTGNFIADGTLEVLLVGGYTPEVGSSFQIVSTTGTVSGTFDVLDLPGAAEEWDVVYGSTAITLSYLGEPGCAPGGILYVDADATGDNDGSSWTNAYLTLQDALAEACTCEEPVQIWVAEGTYYPDQGAEQTNNLRTSTFTLCSGVAIYGGFDGSEENLEDRDWVANPTMLHGDIDGDATLANNAYNVVTGSGTDSTALLSGFTIIGGNANGGGTYPASNNNGAGMHTNAGSPSIEYCTFSGNTAGEDGGGMMNHTNSNPSISHCTFTGNTARYGGGMSNYNSCLTTVTNTKFTGNTATGGADGYGGAVANYLGGSPTFINCHFSGNKANWGGAIFNYTNCHSTIINSTLSGNWAVNAGAGGALRNSIASTLTIINSIIWNNRNGTTNTNTSASILNYNGGTSTVAYSLVANSGGSGNWNAAIGTDGGNNIDANPQFTLPVDPATAPTTTGNLSLTAYSPAIGLGSNDEYDVVGDPQNDIDLANNPRVFDFSNSGIIDMGAYEFQGQSSCPGGSIIYVNATASGANNGTSWANAYTKLQDALFTACSCSGITQVWVAAGTYYPDEGNGQTNNLRTSSFPLCTGKAIYGGFNGTETLLSQRNWLTNITTLSGDIDQISSTTNNAYHVVTGSGTSSSARLDGFTITLGNANDLNAPHKYGGGVYNDNGSPSVANCIISNNRAREGGGMYNLVSATQVSGCTFIGNLGEVEVGGMKNQSSTPIVTNTNFISNTGTINMGAVGNIVSNTQFLNCKFVGNSITGGAGGGGAVFNGNASARFINCQFSGNKSNNRGGAIFNTTNSHSKIINCSLSGNSAGNNGGAIFNEMNSDPQITNSMIWNNRANGVTTSTSASVYNLDGTCIPTCNNNLIANSGGSGGGWQSAIGSDGGNNIDANPQFVTPVDPATAPTTTGNLQLTSYSPLNLGSNAAYDVVGDPQNDLDLANNPRVFEYSSSGIIDMGAYEFQGQSSCPGGSIVYVNATASGANNGTSWANAYTKLQDALFTACSCSGITQVWVAAGTYYPDEGNGQTNNNRNSTFQLCSGKSVYGGFDGTETTLSERDWDDNETILSGNIDNLPSTTGDAYHVVLASNTNNTALLDGFTITKGNANGTVEPLNMGGGVYKASGAAKFQNIYFTLNLASVGASYYSLAGSSTLTDCTFENNSGSVVVGGVVNQASPAVITRCHFIDNFGGIETAAVGNTAATVTFIDCSFTGNEAGVGNGNAGAVHSWNSTVNFYNCLFSGNRSTRNGGAIFNTYYTTANIINCTFSGNRATLEGGAIFNEQNAVANVRNSIIWNNRAGTSTSSTSASIFNSTATTNVSYSLVANSGGSGGGWQSAIGVDQGNNIASDPLFVLNVDPATAPTFAGDLHLQTSSTAINAGNNSLNTYPFDLDGNPRIDDDVIDMGAFEQYIPCTPVTWYADADEDGLGNPIDSTEACEAPVGYVANDDDCDDTNNEIGGPITWYIDADADGFGYPTDSIVDCLQPSGYVANEDDCDDTNEEIGGPTTWYIDADEDGLGEPNVSTEACLAPSGYVANDDDCDDTDPEIGGPTTYYFDADEDGYGDPSSSSESCVLYTGFVENNEDCDDTNNEIGGPTTWYIDADADGFGYPTDSIVDCLQPSGYVANDDDCDDTDPGANPDAIEICNDIDDDCDGNIDEGNVCVPGCTFLTEPSSSSSEILWTKSVPSDLPDYGSQAGLERTGPVNWSTGSESVAIEGDFTLTYTVEIFSAGGVGNGDCMFGYAKIDPNPATILSLGADGRLLYFDQGYILYDYNAPWVNQPDVNAVIGNTVIFTITRVGGEITFAVTGANGGDRFGIIENSYTGPIYPVTTFYNSGCRLNSTLQNGGYGNNAPVDTDLSWQPVAEADGYYLNAGTTSGGIDILDHVDAGPSTTYDFPGDLPDGTTIYVTVIPYNEAGEALECDEEQFTTCTFTTWYADADNDGFGNPSDSLQACEAPSGFVNNNEDNCPESSNPLQEDFDTDMLGDACDPDDDNDGVADTEDGCPFDPDKSEPGLCGCNVTDIDAAIAPAAPSIACQGESEVLTASGGTSYLWSTGETTSSIEVSPAVTTAYAVTVSTSMSCSDTASVVVEVQNQAPYFEYTGNIGFEENIVYPTTGSPYTQYHFEVTYVDADGDMPISAFPKLKLDFEGNGIFTDPNDRSHLMQPADPSDLNVVDGKVYYYNAIGLEPGTNWEASFVAITEDGCDGQSLVYDVPDILVSPDVYLFANDISFSEPNPDPGEEFTVYTVIHNGSDFSADDFTVRLLNHFTEETYTDIVVSSLAPHETMTVNWVINAPAEPSWNPMRVTVDYQNTIEETNELNNTAVRPFICGDFNLPGTIVAYTAVSPDPSYEGLSIGLYGTAYYSGTAVPLQDSSCAGATVTFTIVETNQTFVTETSANGFFSTGFIAPPPGTYTIEGEVTDYTLTGYFTASFTVIEPPVIPCAIDYVCAFSGDFYIIEGESVAPQFIVTNAGCDPATATSSASVLREGGPGNEEFIVPALGGGGTQVYNLSPITYTNPGTYTLYGAVDQGDDILESREDNNVCIVNVSVVPNLPDIHAHDHAPIGPLYLCFEQGLSFSFGNAGVAPTGQFITRLEIFNASNDLVKLETVTTSNLNYGESASIGFSGYTFPATGQYTAKVTCDYPHPPGVVVESSEGNNTFEISFWVINCGVNLVWHSICEINQGVTPVNPTNPGSITVSRRLVNAGTEDATSSFPVTFEVNGNVYDEVVPALAVGESAQVTMTIPAPTHGDHDILFTIDPEQTLAGEDPGGNIATEPLCWDFSVLYDEVCHPGSIWNYPYLVIDQPVTFDIGLVNYGLYKASPVHVSFEVSGPGISGWLDLGEVTMNGPIGKTCGCPINVSLPYTYSFDQVGLFSVRMIVDPEDVFTECNESNNEIILQILVINVPDLKVLSQYIDPSELNPDVNEEISFNVTYQNTGMSNVQETFELLLLVDEVPIDSLQVPGLITGDFNTVSIPNTWSSLLPGLHIIRAIIDADDEVLEATNANNEATRAVIVGASTNLNFLAFMHTAPSGGSLDITGTIRNAGSLGCTADLELYYVDDFGDEHLITVIPVDIDGNSNIPFSHTWSIEDNNTTLIGRIVNVSEMEYNEDDNEATSVLQVITLDIVVTEENCIGSNDGTATVSPAGGTTPYDFQWSNGFTGPSITIGAGQYILSVTDANGNLTTATVIIDDSGIPMQVYYLDADSDGFGDIDHDTTACGQPSGYANNTEDCDDTNADVNPSVSEICNGIDDDCDGLIDDADPGITGQPTWYIDADNDGYGDVALFVIACDQPSGYVSNAGDCNDADASIHPNVTELCNEIDDDCDGLIDEGTTDTDGDGICDSIDNCPSTSNPDQADNENDGIGDVCDPNDDNDPRPDNNDCAPFDPTIYPGAPEICGDLIDNDCDGKIDEQLKIEVLLEQDVLCHGDATGMISVTGECGLPPYTYQWTNDSTTAMITNLIAGQYKVTVTDAQGLTKTKTINITQPTALSLTMTKTDVSCFGGSDGTAKATPNGGNAPYTYLWSNGATTKINSGLSQGTYTVTVTDENGCTISGTIGVGEPTLLEITNTVVSPDPVHPGKYMITVTAQGGTPYNDGYRYRRCNTAGSGCNGWQVSNVLTNLNPGYYLVKVKDANGCIDELIVDIEPVQSMVAVIEQIEMDVDNVRVEPVPIIEIETEPEPVHFDFTSLYPNPGKEMVMIQWNGSVEEMVNIVVYDIHGRKIMSRMTDGKSGRNTLEIDMSSLSEGLYIITLHRANLKYSKVWIKIE